MNSVVYPGGFLPLLPLLHNYPDAEVSYAQKPAVLVRKDKTFPNVKEVQPQPDTSLTGNRSVPQESTEGDSQPANA